MKLTTKSILFSTALLLLAARVYAAGNNETDGHGGKTIGQTTALIAEAGLATVDLKDGESGNTNFPFAQFKALATVGEVDAKTGNGAYRLPRWLGRMVS